MKTRAERITKYKEKHQIVKGVKLSNAQVSLLEESSVNQNKGIKRRGKRSEKRQGYSFLRCSISIE
ncbi:hypothetical protein [Bacteroides sp.]|uniref:hypothetical protein n=1 Tax=Bacteroides sp. TaxID=29523 RepID=UPI001B60D637|nr:hypothetical protein [Bacteroides sp.]MBP8622267.1 hypothetical protein [Bacteroides sp.]